MQNKPMVSVILPTFNRATTVSRAIRSVIGQSYRDLELIVVDDGSLDNTEQIVGNMDDNRIRFLRISENRGAAQARNLGIEAATGKYIAFQDSDDEWLPGKLEKQVGLLTKLPKDTGLVYSDMIGIGKDGLEKFWKAPEVKIGQIIDPVTLDFSPLNIGIQTTLIRKTCFDKVGNFDSNFPKLIDLELLLRMLISYSFFYIKEALVIYRRDLEGISTNIYNEFVARQLLLEKYSEYIDRKKKFRAYQHYRMGKALISSGRFHEGKRDLRKAFSEYPINPKYACHVFAGLFSPHNYDLLISSFRYVRKKVRVL